MRPNVTTYPWGPEVAADFGSPVLEQLAPPSAELASPVLDLVPHVVAPATQIAGHRPLLAAAGSGYHLAKRALDVVLAGVLLVVCVPIFAIIALAILIDSGPTVFFTQERVGARRVRRGGASRWELRTFRILKFRTMVAAADNSQMHRDFVYAFVNGQLDPDGDDMAPFKLRSDARVTRVGRWLRATSLDELPQIVNVLSGSMSLVGPRPVPVYEVESYEDRHLDRLAGLPGITGLWQIEGRGAVTFEEMVDLDVEYLRAQSLWLDLCLLARTVPSACSRKGAR